MQVVERGEQGSFALRFGAEASEVRARIAMYMSQCPVVYTVPSRPVGTSKLGDDDTVRSDGMWVWVEAGRLAFEAGKVDPIPEFVDHVLATGEPPNSLSSKQVSDAIATIKSLPAIQQ